MRERSKKLHQTAMKYTPGGVSSPVRAFSPFPISMKSGKGQMIIDVDDNSYIDLCMAYGPLIMGHAPKAVRDAVLHQFDLGTTYGTPSEAETELLKRICARLPSAESVRLMNSGTEATMHAVRLARGHTGRNGIIMMNGGFHGAHDTLLAKTSDAGVTPSSKGIPTGSVAHTRIAEYNDPEMLETIIDNGDIAAVIMEPILGNTGVIPPEKGYLQKVRKITADNDVLLIFDEVITGFRVAIDSAQGLFGVTPDLTTLGKIIGGGFPAGAVAGKKEIMDNFAPVGGVYQAGTFSGNPMTAVAGSAIIDALTTNVYKKLNDRTRNIVSALEDSLNDAKVCGCVTSAPSMFQVFFGIHGAKDRKEASKADTVRYRELFEHMLDAGIYLPPSAFEVCFLCTEHSDEDLGHLSEEFNKFIGGA